MSDHDNLIHPDLTIDRAALFRLAHRNAAAERAGCLAVNYDKPYARCLAEALRHLWDHIHTRLEIERMKQQQAPVIDRAAAIRREIELLAFCVGIEVSWQIRNKKLYAGPFRLDHKASSQYRGDTGPMKAGHFSRQMAVPWQTDFFSCAFQSGAAWWPAQRPIAVYLSKPDFDEARSKPAGPRKSQDWARPLSGQGILVEHFYKLGLVYEGPPSYHLERERNSSVP